MTHPRYVLRGFRLRGNTLLLLFGFFLIGLFLHYRGQSKPVVTFWNDVRRLVGLKADPRDVDNEATNPYKAPESDTEATATFQDDSQQEKPKRKRKRRSDADNVATEDRRGQQDVPVSTGPKPLFEFEKQVDFLLPAFRSSDEIVRHDGYVLRFRNEYKHADWVAYPLLPENITGDTEREGSNFQPDPDVPGSPTPQDYSRSGYDRGHLAPAGDFKFSRRLMSQTFYMTNMSPQVPEFNRGIWKELEEQVRRWGLRDRGLYVVTGPVLRPNLPTIGRRNRVAVPEQYYKVLLYCNNSATARPNIRMIGYVLRNEDASGSLKQFVTSVDDIERLTGVDFFPKIPDDLERRLESAKPKQMISEWYR